MNPLLDFEIVFVATVIIGMLTQVIFPLYRGAPLFPLFRHSKPSKREELNQELADAKREIEELKLQAELQKTREEALQLRLDNFRHLEHAGEQSLESVSSSPEKEKTRGSVKQ